MTEPLAAAFDDFQTTDTLLVTVEDSETVYESGKDAIEKLAAGESVEQPDTISFPDLSLLFDTFDPRTVELLETIRSEEPESIRATARAVERDPKNVHEELTQLSRLGAIKFEQDGRGKRPIFPYREVVIDLPFDRERETETEEVSW